VKYYFYVALEKIKPAATASNKKNDSAALISVVGSLPVCDLCE